MALNLLGLGFVFEAVDHASHVIKNIESSIGEMAEKSGLKIEGMKESFAKLATGLAAGFAGWQGLVKAFGFAEAAAEDEQAMLSLRATTSATTEELEAMEAAAVAVSKGGIFSDTTALKTLETLRKQGFDTADAIEMLGETLSLSKITKGALSPDAAAAGLAKVMKSYEIDVKDAGLAVDQMAQATRRWGLSAEQLPSGLSRAEQGARAINATMTEVMMVTGLVKDGFRSQTDAMVKVGQTMSLIASDKTAKQFRQLKQAVSLKDEAGEFRKFSDIAGDLSVSLAKMGPDKERDWLEKTFGKRSVMEQTIQRIRKGIKDSTGEIVTGTAAVHAMRDGYVESTGTAQTMIDILMSGFIGAQERINTISGSIKSELGEGFLTVLNPALQKTADLMEVFLNFLRETPAPLKTAAAWLFVAAAGITAIVGGIIALGVVHPIAMAGWKAGIGVLGGFAKAAWAAVFPMLPWIALAVVIAGALWFIYDASDETKEMIWKFALVLGSAAVLVAFFSSVMGYSVVAALGLTTAVGWLSAAFGFFTVTLLANPLGLIVVACIALVFWLIKISGGWKEFVVQWKVGVKMMGEFFDEYLIGPVKKAWEWVTKLFGFVGDKKGASKVNAGGQEDIATGIMDRVRVDRSGRVIDAFGELVGEEEAKPGEGGIAGMLGGLTGMPGMAGMPGMPTMPTPTMPAGLAALKTPDAGLATGAGSQADIQAMLAQASESRAGAAPASFDYTKFGEELKKLNLHASFDVDGERIAEAMARANRTNAARGGSPVNYSE